MEEMFEILEKAAVDEMEERMNNPTMAGKKNLVFRGNDHCHCERVEHSPVSGADVVFLDLSVTKSRVQLKVH